MILKILEDKAFMGIYRKYLTVPHAVRKTQTISIFIITGIFLLLDILSYQDVVSKLYFARGYSHYLNHRENSAISYYGKSLDAKHNFIQPILELISIFEEDTRNTVLLKELADRVESFGNEELYAKIAAVLADSKNYDESIKYYKKAKERRYDVNYSLAITRNFIERGNFSSAESELKTFAPNHFPNNEPSDEFLFYTSLIDYHKGNYKKAKSAIYKILNTETVEPTYFILGAKILSKLGDKTNALDMLSKALYLKKELPEAYFEKAKIYYSMRDYTNSKEILNRTLYYNNQNSLAYVMLQMVYSKSWLPLKSLKYDKNINFLFKEGNGNLSLIKGDSFNITAVINSDIKLTRFKFGILEPYGFGLRTKLIETKKGINQDGSSNIHVVFNVEGLRSSKINLNHPWVLNLVLVDINRGVYCNKELFVTITDKRSEEGRILFVITEDNEQIGDPSRSDDTPEISDIDPYEININMVEKGLLADKLANEYNVKWSHIIDIGSTLLTLKWLQNRGHEWDTALNNRISYLKKSLSMGHDIQLHIHAYSIPDNKFSRQYFDESKKKIMFRDNTVRMANSDGAHGAWAENYTNYGSYDNPETRVGSIYRGIQELENELHRQNPSYRTVFFRAGEYEFGKDRNSVMKSILALRKNQILSGSDAHLGSPFKRDFKFFRPVGKNVYFTKSDSIRKKADSLLDIGILQILPVPKINAHDYVTPIDEGKHIKYNYDLCLLEGRKKDDIFILMEMYHLGNINTSGQWDRLDANYGDWLKLKKHFKFIKENCPKIEFVTISDAIKLYLERYTPDIIALRTNERKVGKKTLLYDVQFIGKDIEVSRSRPHFVSMKPPSYLLRNIKCIDLLYNGNVIKTWSKIETYDNLDFTSMSTSGYQIKVYLN